MENKVIRLVNISENDDMDALKDLLELYSETVYVRTDKYYGAYAYAILKARFEVNVVGNIIRSNFDNICVDEIANNREYNEVGVEHKELAHRRRNLLFRL